MAQGSTKLPSVRLINQAGPLRLDKLASQTSRLAWVDTLPSPNPLRRIFPLLHDHVTSKRRYPVHES
jgi:hypothetical protein